MRGLLCTLVLFTVIPLRAVEVPLEFEDPQRQQLYQELLHELRCLVCQNQNLADSHAELARDLRTQVYRMVEAGESKQDIAGFLVDRYGDFVLYRPPLKASTLLLWLGPFVLLLVALIAILLVLRQRRISDVSLDPVERAAVEKLLAGDRGGNSP